MIAGVSDGRRVWMIDDFRNPGVSQVALLSVSYAVIFLAEVGFCLSVLGISLVVCASSQTYGFV